MVQFSGINSNGPRHTAATVVEHPPPPALSSRNCYVKYFQARIRDIGLVSCLKT
jgi:hypothetical protein